MDAPDPTLLAQLDFLEDVRDLAAAGGWKKGATKLHDGLKQPQRFGSEEKAQAAVRAYLFGLMENDEYLISSALAWPRAIFEQRPAHIKRIFDTLAQHDLVILLGASGLSKSFCCVAKCVLDFFRDPVATSIKIGAVNDRNLRGNLWSNILTFTDAFLFPVELRRDDTAMALSADRARPDCGVSSVLFGRKQDSTGKIKGVHPKPFRGYTHPKFGNLTCVRILLDEVNTLLEGVRKDMGSPQSTIDPATHVMQIILTLNPDDEKNWAVELAKPTNGWREDYCETLYDWRSVHGWQVCRLDGAHFENVRQRKIVFPGFLTYEGFRRPLYGGTEPTAEFSCVDKDTELLSANGWVGYKDVNIGDSIYTVNPTTGRCEWCTVEEMFSKRFTGNLVEMRAKSFSAVITPNHRWAVTNNGRLKRRYRCRLTFKETNNLAKHDLIPLIREPPVPPVSNYTADQAAILGWLLADGTMACGKCTIYQSQRSHAEKCDQIRALLTRTGTSFSEAYIEKTGMISFRVRAVDRRWIAGAIGEDKRVTPALIMGLGLDERKAMLAAMIAGDGGVAGTATRYVSTCSEHQAGMYSMLAALCGYAHTTRMRITGWVSPGWWASGEKRPVWSVHIRSANYARNHYLRKSVHPYNDVVWCPRTRNGTFLARRNGTTYLTGNTYSRGWPPASGTTQSVVPGTWFDQAVGEPIFSGKVQPCASLDPNSAGENRAILAVGRYGVAVGWRAADGQEFEFINRKVLGQAEERHCLVVDNLIRLFSQDEVSLGQEARKWCEKLQIPADFFVVDQTGPGHAVMTSLRHAWGLIIGLHWSEMATEVKILAEDREGAAWQVDKKVSEIWWTVRQWINPIVRGFFINPAMQPEMKDALRIQLTTRSFRYREKDDLAEVEPKKKYIARGMESPDEADAVAQLTYVPRIRGLGLPALVDEHAVTGKGQRAPLRPPRPKHDLAVVTDALEGVGQPEGTTLVKFRTGYDLHFGGP